MVDSMENSIASLVHAYICICFHIYVQGNKNIAVNGVLVDVLAMVISAPFFFFFFEGKIGLQFYLH